MPCCLATPGIWNRPRYREKRYCIRKTACERVDRCSRVRWGSSHSQSGEKMQGLRVQKEKQMSIKLNSLVVGMATYVPGLRHLTGRKTGGTVSARYCYSVWLRHLSMLYGCALPTKFETTAELGPGDSLGIGLAAMLSGTERYLALDAIQYANNSLNLQIFEELIALFRAQAPIPDDAEFPLVQPPLPSYAFPSDVLTSVRLEAALNPKRLELIRAFISSPATTARADAPICYIAPWEPGMIRDATVDLVLSQSVLEYPQDLAGIYAEMCCWLKRG